MHNDSKPCLHEQRVKPGGLTLQAERGYRQGLALYPKNPALLRSYSQFMQDVKLNPHASMRYWVEADKLEAQQLEVCVVSCVPRFAYAPLLPVCDQCTVQCIFELKHEPD